MKQAKQKCGFHPNLEFGHEPMNKIDEVIDKIIDDLYWKDSRKEGKKALLATILAALPKQRDIPLSDMEVSDASRNLTLDEVQEALEELFT